MREHTVCLGVEANQKSDSERVGDQCEKRRLGIGVNMDVELSRTHRGQKSIVEFRRRTERGIVNGVKSKMVDVICRMRESRLGRPCKRCGVEAVRWKIQCIRVRDLRFEA